MLYITCLLVEVGLDLVLEQTIITPSQTILFPEPIISGMFKLVTQLGPAQPLPSGHLLLLQLQLQHQLLLVEAILVAQIASHMLHHSLADGALMITLVIMEQALNLIMERVMEQAGLKPTVLLQLQLQPHPQPELPLLQ